MNPNQIIDETHAGYIVTVDRAEDKQETPPRILSGYHEELPTDEELLRVHECLGILVRGRL